MLNRNPLISVIVPVFNSRNTVIRTLDSVFNQTYKNIEIVVVNDGSTDDSADLIQSFFSTHTIAHIFKSIDNRGLANARNVGWSLANGDYCLNLDSDDYLEPNIIQKVFDTCQSFDICYYGFRDVDCETLKEIYSYNQRFKFINNLGGYQAAILKLKRTIWICQGSCIYNKRLFNEKTFNIAGINQGEDLLFITSMLFFSKKVICVEEIGVNIVSSPTSMMHKDYNESFCQGIEAAKTLFDRIHPLTPSSELIDLMTIEIDNQVSRVEKAIACSKGMSFTKKINVMKQIRNKYYIKLKKQKRLITRKKRLEFFFLNRPFLFFFFVKIYRLFSTSK